ncbi:hypothetical protein IYY11_15310 [Methylocystis sp. H62]|uniref:hypothetical protein n=1 Tax=Methylocystis sp. H62 TaxID=2785789 RepID=UPI0018C24BCE|nr:hypothetical protein [Methylocystis sp. H62]MBG0794722.1 hypothetical protein [Methylocystis sp. H62]
MSDDDAELKLPVIDELKVGDRQYQLLSRKCASCDEDHYEIWRWCGASFARWHMPHGFKFDEFRRYVELADEQLLMNSDDLLNDFHAELQRVNTPDGIKADWSYSFRLVEYARQRTSLLNRLGFLDVLLTKEPLTDTHLIALRAAFELGHAASERRLLAEYEDALFDGFAMAEWREAGLPKAREERIRQGERTRAEVLNAAAALYAKDPSLVRNDSETARQMLKMNLPGLQKGNGVQVTVDAITRHLRDSRRHHN